MYVYVMYHSHVVKHNFNNMMQFWKCYRCSSLEEKRYLDLELRYPEEKNRVEKRIRQLKEEICKLERDSQ